MSDDEKMRLLELVRFRGNVLRYRSNDRKVPRIADNKRYVKLLGKEYYASEVIALCIQSKPPGDGRCSASTKMAAENPGMVISRDDARALGFTLFRTGKPCKRGHTGWRSVAGGACVQCRNARLLDEYSRFIANDPTLRAEYEKRIGKAAPV